MQMLEEMVSNIQATGVPFILRADWNMEVSEIRESGIEDYLDARIVFPERGLSGVRQAGDRLRT
eukprot:8301885-Pyramimonas_sp.AAC.1